MKTTRILLLVFITFSLLALFPLTSAYALDSKFAEQGYFVYEHDGLNYEPQISHSDYQNTYSYQNNKPTYKDYNYNQYDNSYNHQNSYNYQNSYIADKSYYAFEYKQPNYNDYYYGYNAPSKLVSAKFIYYPSDTNDNSYWRNKQPYFQSDYPTEDYGIPYYYSPRLSQDGSYNWRY